MRTSLEVRVVGHGQTPVAAEPAAITSRRWTRNFVLTTCLSSSKTAPRFLHLAKFPDGCRRKPDMALRCGVRRPGRPRPDVRNGGPGGLTSLERVNGLLGSVYRLVEHDCLAAIENAGADKLFEASLPGSHAADVPTPLEHEQP